MKPEIIEIEGELQLDHEGIFVNDSWIGYELKHWHERKVKIKIEIEELK